MPSNQGRWEYCVENGEVVHRWIPGNDGRSQTRWVSRSGLLSIDNDPDPILEQLLDEEEFIASRSHTSGSGRVTRLDENGDPQLDWGSYTDDNDVRWVRGTSTDRRAGRRLRRTQPTHNTQEGGEPNMPMNYTHVDPNDMYWSSSRSISSIDHAYTQDSVMITIHTILNSRESIDWDDDPFRFWQCVAYETGFDCAEKTWLTAWNATARRRDTPAEDWVPSFVPFGVNDRAEVGVLVDQAIQLLEDLDLWSAFLGWNIEPDPALLSLCAYRPRPWCEWCHECESALEDNGQCPETFHCDHCGSWVHGDQEDHDSYCREDCTCSECRRGRWGEPEDDMGWPEETPLPTERAPDGRRRFGIEIEYNGGQRSAVVREMMARGIACQERSYTHEVVRYWKLVEDASVNGGEAVSPIMIGDDNSIEQVLDALRAVKAADGITGSNCGMHVHIDCTDFDNRQLRTLAKNLRRVQHPMEAFLPSSRYDGSNQYCRQMRDSEWDAIENWMRDVDVAARCRNRENRDSASPLGRYFGFNFNALLTYGTVEVRMLGHTLNTVKVRTWIRICQAVFVASMKERTIRVGTDFITWLTEHGDLDEESAAKYREIVETRGRSDWLKAA